jgi:hypothetical protein
LGNSTPNLKKENMLSIPQAIKDNRFRQNSDGTYTIFGEITLYTHSIYGVNDPKEWQDQKPLGYWKGKCYDHRKEMRNVEIEISTLKPKVNNGDIIATKNGRVRVCNIEKGSGECRLYPLDGQELSLRGSGVVWGTGNIFQLPDDTFRAHLLN